MASNNQQWLICHKTKQNQIQNIFSNIETMQTAIFFLLVKTIWRHVKFLNNINFSYRKSNSKFRFTLVEELEYMTFLVLCFLIITHFLVTYIFVFLISLYQKEKKASSKR